MTRGNTETIDFVGILDFGVYIYIYILIGSRVKKEIRWMIGICRETNSIVNLPIFDGPLHQDVIYSFMPWLNRNSIIPSINGAVYLSAQINNNHKFTITRSESLWVYKLMTDAIFALQRIICCHCSTAMWILTIKVNTNINDSCDYGVGRWTIKGRCGIRVYSAQADTENFNKNTLPPIQW